MTNGQDLNFIKSLRHKEKTQETARYNRGQKESSWGARSSFLSFYHVKIGQIRGKKGFCFLTVPKSLFLLVNIDEKTQIKLLTSLGNTV